jgi:hypothetical protein
MGEVKKELKTKYQIIPGITACASISPRLRTYSGRTMSKSQQSAWRSFWMNMTISHAFYEDIFERRYSRTRERLTLFMRDGSVSRTTNPVENYYRQTDPEQIKDKYKTDQGILSYLARKMEYWTAKLGRCLQHPTS